MSRLKNWISYYKNSLSDSENLAIDISRIQNIFYETNFNLETASLLPKNATSLIEIEEKRINKLKGISKKDSPKWHVIDEIEIVIAPFQLDYSYSTENFQQKTIHPFWIAAKINKEGELFPPKELFPLIVRNYLSPITDQGNGFIFASMQEVEEAKGLESPSSDSPENPISWAEYIQYINSVFLNITQNNLDNYRVENYTTSQKALYFATSSKIATAKSILFLYQNLVQETENLPLLTKIANPSNRVRKEAITNQDFLNYNHLHLGQMSDDFPLSISQRKSLLSHLTAEENSVTAVNGPPGTGKTTLLQSLVATEVVKAAVKGEEAPLILACSTNNQAVTNIIDSFVNAESTFSLLADRWIPNFNGYATYLPSNSKNPKNLENINFLKGNLFGHEGTLCELENEEYLLEAERYFLNHFNEYSENKTENLEEACDQLRDEIIHLKNQLEEGVTISKDYLKSIKNVNGILLQKEDYMTTSSIAFSKLKKWREIVTGLQSKYKEPNFIDEIKTHFKAVPKINLDTIEDANYLFKVNEELISNTEKASNFLKYCLKNINLALSSNLKLNGWKLQNNIKGYPIVSEEKLWKFEYQKKEIVENSHRFFYDELDLNLRHKAFLLAIHYWEARWIMETFDAIENNTEKGTGEKAISAKWKRRAMLTPCFVATFYMAPAHFLYSQYQGENENGNPIFNYLPLFNFIDLLIIDEAGQVTPEVSIPVFSLAKKAIVVGDIKQIEPIWSIPPKIDFGNLINENIVNHPNDSAYLEDIGFLASSGSIMKMAQNACEYQTTIANATENGLQLLEHRRCNDEIINFCNELAYNGTLKPMKGKADANQLFPSMMAYHIDGLSEKKYNSRYNLNEVKSIVNWMHHNKENLKTAYNVEDIESVLGIITPFTSQKAELSKALTAAGFEVNNIKLGTVHALQGAERSIVLFSSVYTLEDEGTLFFDKDNKPNMLNVAVSRAKDSFILFGDTRIFDETNNSPSGILKKHLNVYEMTY